MIIHFIYFHYIFLKEGFEDKVTIGLARLEITLLGHSQMLRRLICDQPSTSTDGDLDLDLIPTPVKTEDELAELSSRFLEDRNSPKTGKSTILIAVNLGRKIYKQKI